MKLKQSGINSYKISVKEYKMIVKMVNNDSSFKRGIALLLLQFRLKKIENKEIYLFYVDKDINLRELSTK